MSISNLKKKIWQLAPKGLKPSWIADRLNTTPYYVTQVITAGIPEDCYLINREDIALFRELVKVGDVFKVRMQVPKTLNNGQKSTCYSNKTDSLIVDRKYPYIVETNKGQFRWSELLIMIKNA